MAESLEYRRSVKAPAEEVYRAFTRATPLRDWLCDVALADARPGGRIYLWWNSGYYVAGEYTTLMRDCCVAFTWMGKGEPGPTQVELSLEGNDQVTEFRLTHSGIGTGDAWERARAEFDRGWIAGLENLKSLLEKGEDLRYTRRPMLGINLGDYTARVAQRLGVPITEGIWVTGTLHGFAADQAGLQGDDVIVSLDGKPTPDYPALAGVLQSVRAGDTVEAVFYRGGPGGAEPRTTPVTMSSRYLPQIPTTPAELSAAIHGINVDLLDELKMLTTGLSEERARRRPAPAEWSALEVLAHLVVTERETHVWLTDLINDDERFSDRLTDSTNVAARLAALIEVHPSVAQLTRVVADSLRETEVIVAALPDEITRHKGNYWRIAHNLLQNDQHWEEHMRQIEDALSKAD